MPRAPTKKGLLPSEGHDTGAWAKAAPGGEGSPLFAPPDALVDTARGHNNFFLDAEVAD